MQKPKVLIYTSSASRVPHREGGGHETGTWLSELTDTMEPLLRAGAVFDFITPDGKPCVIDEKSKRLRYWGFSKKKLADALTVLEELNEKGLRQPKKVSDVLSDHALLDSYDALFLPGGHAPMTDVLFKNWFVSDEYNTDTGELLRYFHDAEKPTGSICHGPASLAAAPDKEGKWIYDGYEMTCVSDLAETLTEDIPFANVGGHLKDYPKQILKKRGGKVKNVLLGRSLVIEDRELMTGQDPVAGHEFGEKFLQKVREH